MTILTLAEAIDLATKLHKGQTRDDGVTPYIVHPMAVMRRVLQAYPEGRLNEIPVAAVLHDVMEDCGVSLEELQERVGIDAALLVEELTIPKGITGDAKTVWLVEHVKTMSPAALLIKVCDRRDNVQDMDRWERNRKLRYLEQTRSMVNAIDSSRGPGSIVSASRHWLLWSLWSAIWSQVALLRDDNEW